MRLEGHAWNAGALSCNALLQSRPELVRLASESPSFVQETML